MSQNHVNRQTDDHIRALDPLEHVRFRPAMYIGGVDAKAMTIVAANVLFDLLPQIRRGTCTAIKLLLLGPRTLQIWNNGQPLSIEWRETYKCSILEFLMTRIGAGYQPDRYDTGTAGLLGIGLQAVNALSRDLEIQVVGQGRVWKQQYQKGRRATELTYVREVMVDDQWTTCLTLTLDEEIFGDHNFDANAIEDLLFNYAHLLPGLNVRFENHVTGDQNGFYASTGLASYLEQENRYKQVLHHVVRGVVSFESAEPLRPVRFTADTSPVSFKLDMAFQFLARPVPSSRSFVNTHETLSHGTHLDVCLRALRDSILGHSGLIGWQDLPYVFNHLTLVVSLWHRWPEFQGNTTRRLINRDFFQRAYEELCLTLTLYFKAHPELLEKLETIAVDSRKGKRRAK